MPFSTDNVTRPAGSNPTSRAGKVKPVIADMYRAHLIVKRDGAVKVNLSTPLPENYQFSLSTNFDNPFNQPLSDLAGRTFGQPISQVATGATAVTGLTTLNKWLSGAVWTGGSLFQLDIPFVLQAYTDPLTEILLPMRNLMQAVAPSETVGGMLRAPGPHLLNNEGLLGGDDITVKIGKFFVLNPCIITNVHESFDTQFDHEGNPISVVINVSILSYYTVTKEDLDKMFEPAGLSPAVVASN